MENRRTQTNRSRGHQDHWITVGKSEQNQPYQGKRHSDWQRKRLRPMIRVQTYQGLQERGGKLESQGNQTNLRKAELERIFQNGINGWDQRLNGVIEKVRHAGGDQNEQNGFASPWCGRRFIQILFCVPVHGRKNKVI